MTSRCAEIAAAEAARRDIPSDADEIFLEAVDDEMDRLYRLSFSEVMDMAEDVSGPAHKPIGSWANWSIAQSLVDAIARLATARVERSNDL